MHTLSFPKVFHSLSVYVWGKQAQLEGYAAHGVLMWQIAQSGLGKQPLHSVSSFWMLVQKIELCE